MPDAFYQTNSPLEVSLGTVPGRTPRGLVAAFSHTMSVMGVLFTQSDPSQALRASASPTAAAAKRVSVKPAAATAAGAAKPATAGSTPVLSADAPGGASLGVLLRARAQEPSSLPVVEMPKSVADARAPRLSASALKVLSLFPAHRLKNLTAEQLRLFTKELDDAELARKASVSTEGGAAAGAGAGDDTPVAMYLRPTASSAAKQAASVSGVHAACSLPPFLPSFLFSPPPLGMHRDGVDNLTDCVLRLLQKLPTASAASLAADGSDVSASRCCVVRCCRYRRLTKCDAWCVMSYRALETRRWISVGESLDSTRCHTAAVSARSTCRAVVRVQPAAFERSHIVHVVDAVEAEARLWLPRVQVDAHRCEQGEGRGRRPHP
jgi:hypothetical protein